MRGDGIWGGQEAGGERPCGPSLYNCSAVVSYALGWAAPCEYCSHLGQEEATVETQQGESDRVGNDRDYSAGVARGMVWYGMA